MLPLLQTLLPIIVTLTTGMSVLLHDSQFDRAAALSVPVPFSTENISDVALMLRDQHTHTERMVVSGSASRSMSVSPSIGPRISDDKKYITSKKMSIASTGSSYVWPSV
jgi:hypothetical protein